MNPLSEVPGSEVRDTDRGAEDHGFTVTMQLQDDYRFLVDFDQEGVPPLTIDEPPPLGGGTGPNAARLLAAAVGNCLSASALLCLRRARIDVRDMRTSVDARLARNERGRWRVAGISVRIEPQVDEADRRRMGRCLELFEDFCIVTQSVRGGIEVEVEVEPTSAELAA